MDAIGVTTSFVLRFTSFGGRGLNPQPLLYVNMVQMMHVWLSTENSIREKKWSMMREEICGQGCVWSGAGDVGS